MSRSYTIAPSWRCLLTHERDDLRWVTIIIGAIRVTEQDASSASAQAAILGQVQNMIADFRATWLGMTRGRRLTGMMWRGVFELELHYELPAGSHRHELIKSMGYDASPLASDERYLVVHTHFVISLGKRTEDDLRRCFARWPGKWQTLAKGLYANQTVTEAVTNLCSYSHKRKLEYTTGGLNDEPVQFVGHYGFVWGRFVYALYEGFDSEFRSKK